MPDSLLATTPGHPLTRRRCLLAGGLALTLLTGPPPAGGEKLVFEKNRPRRIIFNDDAYQQRQHLRGSYPITDEQSFLDARTTGTFGTQVDTYVWCVGNGCQPPWGPWGLKHRAPIHPVLGSSQRATNLVVSACHARGMEVWGSLRMNDAHDANCELAETNDPLKAEHPEYLLGQVADRDLPTELVERHLWSAFNFAHADVRQHRLEFIRRNAAAHDFDGYELDFTRFIWNFPQGQERELAPLLTDFVRQVRLLLQKIARQRGRPYLLVVHVMDSPETSLRLGQDVQTWLAEGLVDVLVVGMGGMPFSLPVHDWKTLAKRSEVPVYVSLHPRGRFFHTANQPAADLWQAWLRGSAAWSWQNGADGMYLFNLFTVQDRWKKPRAVAYAPLHEVGETATLVDKDKLYGIEPVVAAGMFSQGSQAAALPIALDIHERRLALPMGADAGHPGARFKIHALTQGGPADSRVRMRLNHHLLVTRRQGDQWTAEVEAGMFDTGLNHLTIWCNTPLGETSHPILVHEILVSVDY